jgi:uncharacterized protein YjbI with pentapeptide repeats
MNSFTLRPERLVAVLLVLLPLTAVLAEPIVTARRAATAAAPAVSCPASLSATVPDYHGLPLTMCNFAKRDLRGANFIGATLTAVVFIGADLTGADFSGATFKDSGNPALPNDFTLATLTNAKFAGAKFNGLTYLSYATLTCADFSGTVIDNGNAVFGPGPLSYDKNANCVAPLTRTSFAAATMNCEFLDDWDSFDLSGAIVSACNDQFKGRNFASGMYAKVVFDGADLTGTNWSGADLRGASFQSATLDNATGLAGTTAAPARLAGAKFASASVRNVDFSNAQLYGGVFINADLTNSSLQGALLTANTAIGVQTAAKFDGAHLKNVNLGGAKLGGVTFDGASFYGSFGGAAPTFPCQTDTSKCTAGSRTGLTCACASAVGSDLTNADFSNAFLYGVDFGDKSTTINGTKFVGALLAAVNFAGANFTVASGGVPPDFTNAQLQGTNFGTAAALTNTSLSGAFVDFGAATNSSNGNIVQLQLPAKYTRFRNFWLPSVANPVAQPICVQVAYGGSSGAAPPPAARSGFTVAPQTIASMTCPDGNTHPQGCGAGNAGNANWNNRIPLAQATPPGWYVLDATYEKANLAGTCNLRNVDSTW